MRICLLASNVYTWNYEENILEFAITYFVESSLQSLVPSFNRRIAGGKIVWFITKLFVFQNQNKEAMVTIIINCFILGSIFLEFLYKLQV